ncbi:rRNA biogenesis protein rrp5, partial [Kickxella alabastrina]
IIIVSALPHITAFTPRPALTCFELPEAARLATGISDTEFVPGTDEKLWPIPYGTVINDCVVANIVANLGLALQIPGALSVRAFVPAAYLVEDGDAAPTLNRHIGRFRIDTRHRARVIGYDAMDAVIRVSLRPSVVDEKYFTIDDVFPGAIINGTVKRLLDKGAEVVISSNLIGFVHKQELSDTKLKHPELQFKAEKKVTCRVLKILHEKRSVLLTCRKSLVQSKLPTVFGYTEAEGAVPGTITMAIVDRLVAGGAVINFYQGAHGFVPTGTKQLAVGQAVKCRILSANAEKRRISATLDVDENSELSELVDRSKIRANNEFSTDLSQVTTGQVVGGSVTRVADGYVTVRLEGSNLRASMSVGHFSDHRGTILDKIVARTIEGTHLPELVITSIVEKKGRIAVSAKPALIKAAKAGNLPATANDITVGQTMVGWISNTATFGVFVNFPGMITALAPLDMLADRYVAAPSDLFSKDQTVIASVVGIDESEDGNKVRVALKSSVVDTAATGFLGAADYLLGYFNEIEGAADSSAFDCIGAQALVTVKQKHPYGLVVSPTSGGKLPESSSGFITINQAKDRIDECPEGTTVAACVLDVDAEKNIVDFSLRSVLVSEASGLEDASKANGSASADKKMAKLQAKIDAKIDTSRKGLQEAVKKSQETQLVIEIVKEDYLVLSMPLFGNSIAFAATKSYNDCSKPFMRFKVGQRLNGTPVRAAAEGKRTLVLLQRGSDRLSGESSGNGDKAKRAAVKPVDSAINFFEDYQPGVMTKAIVSGIKGGQANLNLASNVKGRLHITELLDDYAAVAEAKSPADVFAAAGVRVGMTIDVKVLGWHDAKVYKFLPITHRASPMKTVIETTVKPSEMATESGKVLTNDIRLATPKTIAAGQVIHGFVKGILEASGSRTASVMVMLGLSLIGYMPILAATSSYKVATHPGRFFIPGMPIEVQVAAVDSNGKSVTVVPHGNYIANVEKPLSSTKQLVPGARVVTSVTAINPSAIFTGFSLVLTEGEDNLPRVVHVHGNVSQFDVSDKLTTTPFKDFTKGKLLDAVVVSVENSETPENMKAILSLRQSALNPEKYTPSDIADPVIDSAADVSHGQIVRGFIKQTSDIGCFIVIGRNMSGRAIISELSDEYVRDIKAAFPPGKFVTAAVIDSNHSANKISLSLRASRVGGIAGTDGDKLRRLDQINVGETLKGTITRIEDYGVFIKPDNSFVTGLCYLREIADSDVPVNPKTL